VPVGSGGMGHVFRARDRATGCDVALKLAAERSSEERFVRECDALASLEHPNIVRHVSHGVDGPLGPYLAMEWLDGEDLATRIARGALGFVETRALAHDLAEALAHAHARGFVHRDLKPGNVFFARAPAGEVVKLLDFGVVRDLRATPLSLTGAAVGTPEYMAPEQVRGLESVVAAADVFALGCVLYECLTGSSPFRARNVAGVLAKVLFDPPADLRGLRPDVPIELAAVIMRMLADKPYKRLPPSRRPGPALPGVDVIAASAHLAPRQFRAAVRAALMTRTARATGSCVSCTRAAATAPVS
jgi:serine/threonine protein kinase